MSTPTIDYDALAKQAGATSSRPAQQSGGVDYDALAKQAGAVSSTPATTQQQPPPQKKSLLDRWAGDSGDDIPMDSYWHATQRGLTTIRQGGAQAVKGAIDTFNPKPQPGENVATANPAGRIVKGLYETGKQALQVPAAVHDINQSADPLGTYANVAGQTAGNAGGQAATAAATEGAVKGAQAVVKSLPTEANVASKIKSTVPEAATLPDKAVAAGDRVYRAVAPVGTDTTARANIHVASGDLAEISKKVDWDSARGGVSSPDMRPRAVLNATKEYMKNMYETERAPQIASTPKAPVKANLAGNAGKGLQFIADAAGDDAIQTLAQRVVKDPSSLTLSEADGLARVVNKELFKFERLDPSAKAQVAATNSNVNGLKALDRELSRSIDAELEAQGKPGIKNYERRMAALANFRDGLSRRVNAAELDQPGVVNEAMRKIPGRNMRSIASASQASTANVRVGSMLESGLKGLARSNVKPMLDPARVAAPFRLTSPGSMPPPTQRPLPLK